jgi:hypothetical protein
MPTTIKTEQARVALAKSEFRRADAETERKLMELLEAMKARLSASDREALQHLVALKRKPRATELGVLKRLLAAEPELCRLLLEREVSAVGRDALIEQGGIATIEDDGRVTWTNPKSARPAN